MYYNENLLYSDYDFHGIEFDYFKMISILEYGILSEQAAKDKGINIKRNFGGHNGFKTVSIALKSSSAYKSYCENSISFAFDGTDLRYAYNDYDYEEGFRQQLSNFGMMESSGIRGERFVKYEIPRKYIKAIMLPIDKINTKVDCIEMITDCGTGYFDSLALSIIDNIYYYFKYDKREEIYELINSKKTYNDIDINDKINKLLSKYFGEGIMSIFNLKECPTLLQTVLILTDGCIDVYANNGQIAFKSEKKKKKVKL